MKVRSSGKSVTSRSIFQGVIVRHQAFATSEMLLYDNALFSIHLNSIQVV